MQMRRAERAIEGIDALSSVLETALVGHLGLVDDEGVYVVPLSFAHRLTDFGVQVYVHGAGVGRKVAAIRVRPEARICFEADVRHATIGVDDPLVCRVGATFDSVIGWGRARVVTDPAEVRAGLTLLIEKYAPGRGGDLPEKIDFVTVLAFDLDELTGKSRQM